MNEQELDKFSVARRQTLAMVATLTQAQADRSQRPGAWSIGEILDHLLLSEELNRREIAALIDLEITGKLPQIDRTLRS